MEAFIAWIIYLGLQFLELCNCFPVTPHSDAGATPPGPELGALAPSLLAALSLLTAVLLLAGCSWCRRIIKKDVVVGQPIPLRNSGTSALVETGIQNPLNDIRYPITAAITNQSPRAQQEPHPDLERSPQHPPYPNQREIEVDNQPFEDNNNGPISEQELENIVNNNAENYIVSEYENRNMNLEANRAIEVFELPQTSRNLSPSHVSPRRETAAPDVLAEHKDWFDNPNEDFPRNQLQYLQVIGRGWFGRIVEGEAHNLVPIDNLNGNPSPRHIPANTVTKVAVKILDENVTVMDKCTFLEECRLYRDLRHENLLKFNGRNLTQDPWLVLFEYCPMGDLKQFLLSNKSQMASLNQKGVPLKLQCEIAAALEYLHRHNLVHPDVACHSCLVAEGPTARLGDYGDSERRHPEDYFSPQGDKPLPVRWLPPESEPHHQVTYEGNMWSFGVFLWESCSWGDLPYEQLSDEQIVTEVMCADGVRLPHPVPNTEYVTYLYNVMQCCWHGDPIQRCASSQVSSYLQNIYSNYHQASSQSEESVTHDFEARWQSLKPNSIPKVDNGLPYTAPSPNRDNYYELKFPNSDINLDSDSSPIPRDHQFVYHNLAISSDTLTGDELSVKAKSDSLTNLHGSFESVLEKNCNVHRDKSVNSVNPPLSVNPQSSTFWETSLTENSSPFTQSDGNSEKLLFEKEVSQVAPWLRDVPFTTPEDISYIKNVSDVISDFDNMLSSEKTSSSESSHQTSPSREVTSNPKSSSGIAVDVSTSDKTQTSEKLCTENPDISKADSVSDLTKCLSDSPSEGTLNDANIDSDIANSPLRHVPEISNMDSKESYPTLDFRLVNTQEETAICDTVPPVETGQEFDSLQDSSYTPDPLKDTAQTKIESGDDNWEVRRQCSSGSETEDEIWKKRIEMGTITEKIKMKSKSVTDFMVLTHIDMDFTDLESEETSYTSMEGKGNMFFDIIQKKFKPDSPPKESSLPTQEYLSFPRNFSFSLLSRVESLQPDLDLYKLWRSHRCMAVKNLRHTKSLNDLTESQTKNVSVKELQMFKVNLDTFLDTNKSPEKGIVSNDPFIQNVKTIVVAEDPLEHVFSFQHTVLPSDRTDASHNQIQFNLPGNFSFHLPGKEIRSFPNISQQPNPSLGFMSDPADHLNVALEEENLKFSSNFNDINLNLYATEHSAQSSNEDDAFGSSLNDPWESTKYINPPDSFHFDVQTNSDTKITNEGPVAIDLFDSQDSSHNLHDKSQNVTISQNEVTPSVLPNFTNMSRLDHESSLSANNFHTDLQTDNVSTSTPVLSNDKTISIENEITLDDVKEIAIDRDNLNTNEIIDNANSQVDQKIQEIMHNEMLNLTTKLAIAENENNLNIEYSGPLEIEQVIEEVYENSEEPAWNDHSDTRENMEVNDNHKVDNNSTETNSLPTGTESGIESHFETMDKQSICHAHGDNLISQRSELEHTCDGSHSTEIESGIVSLDHSEPNVMTEQNLGEKVIGINKLKSDLTNINKMFIESEKIIAIPIDTMMIKTISDEPVSLSDNDLIPDALELKKAIHIAEQKTGSRDGIDSIEQKPDEVDNLENPILDPEMTVVGTKFDELEKETIFDSTDTTKMDNIVRNENNFTEGESMLFHVNADLRTQNYTSDKINVTETEYKTEKFEQPKSDFTDINLQLIESECEIVAEKLPESDFHIELLNDNVITQKCDKVVDHKLTNQQLNFASVSVDSKFESPQLEMQRNELTNSEQPISRDELIQDLDLELQKLDESHYYSDENNSEPQYVNVGTSAQHREGSSSGWFLHPKPDTLEESGKINVAQSGGIQHNFEIAQNFAVSNGSSTESLTENSSSERYMVDAESVEALRNELELKLPLAQRIGQIRHDNISDNLCGSKEWPNEVTDSELMSQHGGDIVAEPCRKVATLNPEPGTSSGTGCSFSEDTTVEEVKSTPQQVRNEVLIHYNMYGVVPLSPIQEESWSEFSEMEKAGDKTDTSNSLSLGEQTSNIENILPFDGVCQAVNTHLVHKHDDKQQNWSDDDTHSDCSNRTFVLNEAGPSNMNRQKSLSADSLDSFDGDNMELDDDNATIFIRKKSLPITSHFPPHSFQGSDLLSPFYDDHSHTKSTEEISQNVDNLLENISKTLENASKMTLSSESNELLNQEIPVDEISLNLSDADNSGSKTYVIDDKKSTVKEMSNVYNNKVAELPADDLSNVSKISQPSFISELTSPNDSEIKPSDKSVSINLHTKTPSMDSWCSNDTLFNVEENFDDVYSNDVLSSPVTRDPLTDSQINTDYSAAVGNTEKKVQDRIPTLYDPFKCGQSLHRNMELPAVEMVMGCTDNIHSLSLHGEDVDNIFSDFQRDSAKNSPDLPIYFVADKVDPAIETTNLNSMNNKSDDSLTAESGISILAKSEIKQSAALDEVLMDSPISTIDSGVLKLPIIHNDSDEVIDTSNEDTYDIKYEDHIMSSFSPSGIVNNTTIVLKSDNPASNNTYVLKTDSTSCPNNTVLDSIEQTDCHPVGQSPNSTGISHGVTHDNSAYVNTFEHLKKAMTSTPTSGFDHMSIDTAKESHNEVVESPDNIIDAQFQFLEGIVDSSISYISFKDDGSQNFVINEKNSANVFPQTSVISASSPVPNSSTDVGSLQNDPSINSQVTAGTECEEIPKSKKICSETDDISSFHFSVIPSEINLVNSDAATHQYELIQETTKKNSKGLNENDISSPNFSIIANSDVNLSDKMHHTGSELDLNAIDSSNLNTIPSSIVIVVDSDKTHHTSNELDVFQDIKKNSTGLVDIGSPNFSIIPCSDVNLVDSNKTHHTSSEHDVIQDIEKNSTGLVDIGSPNFSIIPCTDINLVDSDKTHHTSSELDVTQDIKKNSTGLVDIGSPNFSIIPCSDINLVDSDKTHHTSSELDVTQDIKKNSTGLVDIGSPNFSIIPCSDIILVDSDKTHTSSEHDVTQDIKKNSTGLVDIGSPNFSIIPSSDSNLMVSDETHNISDKLDIIRDIKMSCAQLDNVESENFNSIHSSNINLVDLNMVGHTSSEIQDIKDNSIGSDNISSPIVNITPLERNPVDSNTTKQSGPELIEGTKKNYKLLEDNDSLHHGVDSSSVPILVHSIESELIGEPQDVSTNLGIVCSPNNSTGQLSGRHNEDSIVDVTKNSSKDFIETVMHSTGLGDRDSPNFSKINFPEEKNCVRDWHVNNVTVSFLESERNFSDSLKPKCSAVFLEKASLSNDLRNNLKIDHSPTLESFLENVAMAPQQISSENMISNSTGLVNISSPNLSKIQHDTGNLDVCDVQESAESLQESNSFSNIINYDNSSALEDYVQYTGLNMGSHNLDKLVGENIAKESPTFETFKESAGIMPQDLSIEPGHYGEVKRNSADLSEIQFSGPSNDGMMSTSFNEVSSSSEIPMEQSEVRSTKQTVDDVNHIAPERLKDWDSESDDSNCSSSSSGDFVWKEGGKEQLLSVSTLLYHSPNFTQKNQTPRGVTQYFADIPEEVPEVERDGEEDDEDEEVEFVPSSWDCRATPTKSALKSPETSQMEEEPINPDNRKRVVFKKQKYQCIYEYPREVLSNDDDDLQALPDYSTYSDWHPFGSGNGSYMAVDFENFLNSHPGDLHQPSSDLLSEDDFYISSSTRPFETYNLISSSSQFFPGHHLSLFNKPYSGEATEIDDYDSLPTIPTEYDIQQSHLNAGTDTEDANLVNKASFDYITPDSGTEDITPGSLIDYDFKDPFSSNEPFNKNSFPEVTHIDITNPPKDDVLTEQEIHLNSSNKNGSFGRPFCGTLILPDRGSSSGSLTPSSPSPSASGHSSQSSGSTSPLPPPPAVLGGLRHTRDKLKLDLPPSPLARNSPSIITSGKNANKDVKIFDFKNIDALQSDDLDKTLSESVSDVSSSNTLVENNEYKCDRSYKSLEETDAKCSDKGNIDSELCELTLDGKDPNILEYDDLNVISKMSPFNPISMIGSLIPDKSILSGEIHNSQYEKLSDDAETGQFDSTTLQKAVMPMNDENSSRKASLEPVKGEGTLLDSGDEDSGIGSSAYATLERKMDSKEVEPEASKNSNERQVN